MGTTHSIAPRCSPCSLLCEKRYSSCYSAPFIWWLLSVVDILTPHCASISDSERSRLGAGPPSDNFNLHSPTENESTFLTLDDTLHHLARGATQSLAGFEPTPVNRCSQHRDWLLGLVQRLTHRVTQALPPTTKKPLDNGSKLRCC